jgi:superfamily I DNA/RNA helicase
MQHSLSKYLMLNTDQKAVVDAPLESNIVVIAGAGSGKTTTILRRIEVMVKERGVLPSEILLTTFTVEATKDIKSRIGIDGIQIGTIDAISRGVLQKYAFDWISKFKIMSISEYGPLFLKFLTQHPRRFEYMDGIKYLIVDEYQDISKIQYNIFRKLYATKHVWMTAIGDDSQNIYSFRGSNVSYILNFEHETTPCLRFMLTRNYRCGDLIVNLANASIQRNTNQIPKNMTPHRLIDSKPTVHAFNSMIDQSNAIVRLIKQYIERDCIPLNDIVVLCRMNKPLFAIEALLEKKKIPNLLLDGKTKKKKKHSSRVSLCSIHKSKGLEWDVVIVLECNDCFFPMPRTNIEEERRLFYVATTRAKRYLHFTYTTVYGPSRFLTEVDCKLLDGELKKKKNTTLVKT